MSAQIQQVDTSQFDDRRFVHPKTQMNTRLAALAAFGVPPYLNTEERPCR